MSTNPRQRRNLKKKIIILISLLGILGFTVYCLNLFIVSKKTLFISPVGKVSDDKAFVEKVLKTNGILFSDIILSNNYYLVTIKNSGQVKLSRSKNISEQIASLQRMLREFTIEGKPFKVIDLRFSEPVISF